MDNNRSVVDRETMDFEGVIYRMDEMEIDPNVPPQPGDQLPGGDIYVPPGTSLDDELLMLAGAYLPSPDQGSPAVARDDDQFAFVSAGLEDDILRELHDVPNAEQTSPFDFMNTFYPYLSELSKAKAHYLPRDPFHVPLSLNQLHTTYPQYFAAQGQELENAPLPSTVAETEELSLAVADRIVARSNEDARQPPPSSPCAHMYHPYWVHGQHPSSSLILKALEKVESPSRLHTPISRSRGLGEHACTRITPATTDSSIQHPFPPAPTSSTLPLDSPGTAALFFLQQMYAHFFSASGRDLENEVLPTSNFDTEILSSWVADEIVKRAGDSGVGSYVPPFSPKAHPCYPTWMDDHASNQIILCCFRAISDRVCEVGFGG